MSFNPDIFGNVDKIAYPLIVEYDAKFELPHVVMDAKLRRYGCYDKMETAEFVCDLMNREVNRLLIEQMTIGDGFEGWHTPRPEHTGNPDYEEGLPFNQSTENWGN